MPAVKEALEEHITFGTPYKQESQQSEINKKLVLQEVAKRFPAFLATAAPYVNILTFQQWKARGYSVKKGEKSIRIPIMKEIEDKDKAKRLVRRTACLFAFPQVEKDGKDALHDHDGKPTADCPICMANLYR